MRRPTQTPPRVAPRLQWMTPASPGDLSPMGRLVSWLERNWEAYRASKRKVDMLEGLDAEMATHGIYEVTVSSLRSQISHLKTGVQLKAEGGRCTSKDINRYYDRLLNTLFSEEERAVMRERAEQRERAPTDRDCESRRNRTRSKIPRQATKTHSNDEVDDETGDDGEARQLPATNLQRMAPVDPILDTAEIRRRFELLSARQGLLKQGVDPETIDSFLPLRR